MKENNSFLSEKLTLNDISKSISRNEEVFVNNFFQMEFSWMVGAYAISRDIEKYLIIVHLINKTLETYNKYFFNFSYEKFYSNENIEIEKVSVIEIVNDLNISKETARRKLNELNNEKIIIRKSKKITINKKAFIFQKPTQTLKNLAKLLKDTSYNLEKNEKLKSFSIQDFEVNLRKNYSRNWNNFLNFQIKYMIEGKKYFEDYESLMCIGVCALNQSYNLLSKLREKPENIDDIADSITLLEKSTGLNPTTISDLTGIPRATVIRKLSSLIEKKLIIKNDKNLFTLSSPKKNSQVYNSLKNRFNENQVRVRTLLTELLNYFGV